MCIGECSTDLACARYRRLPPGGQNVFCAKTDGISGQGLLVSELTGHISSIGPGCCLSKNWSDSPSSKDGASGNASVLDFLVEITLDPLVSCARGLCDALCAWPWLLRFTHRARQASASPPGGCKQGGCEKFSVELVAPVSVHVPQQEPQSSEGPGGSISCFPGNLSSMELIRPSASSHVEVAPAQVCALVTHEHPQRLRGHSRRLAAFLGGLRKRERALNAMMPTRPSRSRRYAPYRS